MSHEAAHFFGLVDRYDTSGAGNGLGSFSLMANSWGVDGSQRYPPNLSACDKMEHGWVNIIDIERLGNYQIDSQCDSNTIYRIGNGKFGLPQAEFFLLEYRQSCNYDILLEPGLAIYHYDAHALDVMTNDKSDPLYGKRKSNTLMQYFPLFWYHPLPSSTQLTDASFPYMFFMKPQLKDFLVLTAFHRMASITDAPWSRPTDYTSLKRKKTEEIPAICFIQANVLAPRTTHI